MVYNMMAHLRCQPDLDMPIAYVQFLHNKLMSDLEKTEAKSKAPRQAKRMP